MKELDGLNDTCLNCGGPIGAERMRVAANLKQEPKYCSNRCSVNARTNRFYHRRKAQGPDTRTSFEVPVYWTMTGIVKVQAASQEEADQSILNATPTIKGRYVAGSLKLRNRYDEASDNTDEEDQ